MMAILDIGGLEGEPRVYLSFASGAIAFCFLSSISCQTADKADHAALELGSMKLDRDQTTQDRR